MKPDKKAARRERNRAAKIAKAALRQQNLALVGRLVFEKENPETHEKTLHFPPAIRTAKDGSILPLAGHMTQRFSVHAKIAGYGSTALLPVLSKTHRQSYLSMKNRPGNAELQQEAIVEDASRTFAKAVEAAMTPEVEENSIPVIPMDAAETAATL